MKILFLQYWYDYYGGIETVNDSLATQFSKDGYDVTVLCLWRMGKDETVKDGNYKKIFINTQHKRPSYKAMLNDLLHFRIKNVIVGIKGVISAKRITKSDYKKFTQEIKIINPDQIIVGSYPLIENVPVEYLNKCYLHMHSGLKYYIDNDFKFLLKYKDKINRFIWLSPNFMQGAIENGLDNSTYMYNPTRIRCNYKNKLDNKNVVFIGRIAPEKGLDRLIDIFNECHDKNKEWKLLIYGSGETTGLKFDKKVIGMGSTSDVLNSLKNASIFALTSYREGFPMVLLEAYECGIPVIAYDFEVSSNEIIKDGVTGYIIEQGNKNEYVNKLTKLMNDDKLRLEMGKNAKEFVKQFYPEEVVKRWYKLFRGEE